MNTNLSDIDWIQEKFPGLDTGTWGIDSCPSHDKLWAAAEGSLPRQEWRDVFDHTLECGLCAEGWRLACHLGARPKVSVARQYALEIRSDLDAIKERCMALARVAVEELTAPVRALGKLFAGPQRGLGRQAVVALSALVVVAVSVPVFKALVPTGDPHQDWRMAAASEAVAERGGEIRSALPEQEPLPRDRFVLRWQGGPSDARYQVEVMTEDLRLVDRVSGLEAPEYEVPSENLRDIASGETLLWQVTPLPRDARNPRFETFRVRLE